MLVPCFIHSVFEDAGILSARTAGAGGLQGWEGVVQAHPGTDTVCCVGAAGREAETVEEAVELTNVNRE